MLTMLIESCLQTFSGCFFFVPQARKICVAFACALQCHVLIDKNVVCYNIMLYNVRNQSVNTSFCECTTAGKTKYCQSAYYPVIT